MTTSEGVRQMKAQGRRKGGFTRSDILILLVGLGWLLWRVVHHDDASITKGAVVTLIAVAIVVYIKRRVEAHKR